MRCEAEAVVARDVVDGLRHGTVTREVVEDQRAGILTQRPPLEVTVKTRRELREGEALFVDQKAQRPRTLRLSKLLGKAREHLPVPEFGYELLGTECASTASAFGRSRTCAPFSRALATASVSFSATITSSGTATFPAGG
jgi:hypothetical protein